MKKNLLVLCCVLLTQISYAQFFGCIDGRVTFFSKTSMKDIFAETKRASFLLKLSSNELAIRITNSSFKFDNSLMEEHFNEKYMESNKYPVSTFLGKFITPIEYNMNDEYKVEIKGKFNIHGVEQERTLKGKLTVLDDKIYLKTAFKIKLEDYKILKPKVVSAEIADEVEITVNAVLIKK